MKTILVVDDEQHICELIKSVIELHGEHKVITAKNGLEAFEKFKKETPDLILTDIKMPVRDGFWLVDQVAQSDHPIPVLLMTGFTSAPDEELKQREISQLVRKPNDIKKIRELVDDMLKGA